MRVLPCALHRLPARLIPRVPLLARSDGGRCCSSFPFFFIFIFFPFFSWQILKPLEFTRKLGSFHVRCTARGGGQAGQAGAIRLGLARALEAHDPWLRKYLKKGQLVVIFVVAGVCCFSR